MSVAMRVVVLLACLGAAFSLRKGRAVTDIDSAQVENLGKYLRWSFGVDYKAVQLVSIRTPIFDIPAGSVAVVSREKFFSTRTISEDAAEVSNQNKQDLKLSVAMPGEVSPFNLAAQRSTEMSGSSGFKTFREDRYEKYEKYHVSSTALDREPWLTADARRFLLNRSPAQIESKFGAFYAEDMRLGAQLKFSHVERMSWKETKSSMSEQVNAGYTKELAVDGSVDGSYVNVNTDESRDFRVARMVVGGNISAWHDLDATSSNLQDVKKKWARGVTDHSKHLVPVEMSLSPIWTLLERIDSRKASQVKTYFETKWKSEREQLKHLPAGPHYMRCNWADHSSTCSPLNLVPGCHDGNHCIRKGRESCKQTGFPYLPGNRAKCDCNDVCWQDSATKPCCPTDVSR